MVTTDEAAQAATQESATASLLRGALLVVFVLAVVGTLTELLLLEHFEGTTQYIPLALLAASLLSLGWFGINRSATSIQIFRATAVLLVLGGITGLLLHYRGNALFELDVEPEMHGFDLFWKSLTGATPALAPGSLIQFGLIGLAFTLRHPLLTRRQDSR